MSHWHHFSIKVSNSKNEWSKVRTEAKTKYKTWFKYVNLNRIWLWVRCHTDIIFQSKFQTLKMNVVKLGQKQRHTIKHDLICKFE